MLKACEPIDARIYYLQELLQKDGYSAICAKDYLENKPSAEECPIVLLPLPARKELLDALLSITPAPRLFVGGKLPVKFKKECQAKEIICIDYTDSPELALENAVATAEGAICEAIQKSAVNLHHANCLIIGYGTCGKVLADKLYGLKCNVYISTRSPMARKEASVSGYFLHKQYSLYQFVFNTAPALVLSSKELKKLPADCLIIDIATKPGGTDFLYCTQRGIQAYLCPGLPGKYAPKTSAQIIYSNIKDKLQGCRAI